MNMLGAPKYTVNRPEHWIMYFDSAINLEGAGAGVLLISPLGEQLKYVLQIHYKASNNRAVYEALIHGLRIAVSLGIKQLLAFGDSKVVIEKVNQQGVGLHQGHDGCLLR
jgi:ribonuclease HI